MRAEDRHRSFDVGGGPVVLALSGGFILFLILLALFAPLVAPIDPLEQDLLLEKLPPGWVDYAVFSGTFNLCLIDDPDRWQRYILDALAGCWPRCRHGMALNLLCRRETAIEASIFYAVEADMTAALRRFGRVEAAPTRGLKHDVTFLVTR